MTARRRIAVTSLVIVVVSVLVLVSAKKATHRAHQSLEPRAATNEQRSYSPHGVDGPFVRSRGSSPYTKSGWLKEPGSAEEHLPQKTMVLLHDGRVVPARPGRAKLGDPGVLAQVYEGAPPEAVRKLHHILRTGSNELADFTRTEKYPDWVYEKMKGIGPGKLGEALAFLAEYHASQPAETRTTPMLDLAPGSYGELRGPSHPAGAPHDYGVERIVAIGGSPVAETKDGLVYVWGHGDEATPLDVAVWIAHRMAAGDTELRVPDLPPSPWGDWESWIRDHTGPSMQKDLEDAGILPSRKNRHAAPGNGTSPQAPGHE